MLAHYYPGMPWTSPTYPTRDGIIPASWFDLVIGQLGAIDARRELTQKQAAQAGYLAAKAPEDRAVMGYDELLRSAAYPEEPCDDDDSDDDSGVGSDGVPDDDVGSGSP